MNKFIAVAKITDAKDKILVSLSLGPAAMEQINDALYAALAAFEDRLESGDFHSFELMVIKSYE